jgi:hypothetical protein
MIGDRSCAVADKLALADPVYDLVRRSLHVRLALRIYKMIVLTLILWKI